VFSENPALTRKAAMPMSSSGIEALKDDTAVSLKDRAGELLTVGQKRFLEVTTGFQKLASAGQRKIIVDWGKPLVNAIFGLFICSLVVMLILLHSGVPIFGS
jgi:hypothetical protein